MVTKKPRLTRAPIDFTRRYSFKDITTRAAHKPARRTQLIAPTAFSAIAPPEDLAKFTPAEQRIIVKELIDETRSAKLVKKPSLLARLFGKRSPKQPIEQSASAALIPYTGSIAVAQTIDDAAPIVVGFNLESDESDFSNIMDALNARPANDASSDSDNAETHINDAPPQPGFDADAFSDMHEGTDDFNLPLIADSKAQEEASATAAAEEHQASEDLITPPAIGGDDAFELPLHNHDEFHPSDEPIVHAVPQLETSADDDEEPVPYDDALGGFAAFFSVLTPEEQLAAEERASSGVEIEQSTREEFDGPITWTATLGLEKAPTDPDSRTKLVFLAHDLEMFEVLAQAAAEDPHTNVRNAAREMLEGLRAA